jgi:hypothetical protein
MGFYANSGFTLVMSSKWTSVSIRQPVLTRLAQFCDAYNISSRGDAIKVLLNIASITGLDGHPDTEQEGDQQIDVGSIEDLEGFLFQGPTPRSGRFIGTDGVESVVISEREPPDSQAQPLANARFTDADVYCPGCENQIFEYELSEFLPSVTGGVFADVVVACGTCGADRPAHTLFAVEPGIEPLSQHYRNLLPYWGYTLTMHSHAPDAFASRVLACEAAARDAGWDWLPSPDNWIGSRGSSNESSITAQDYCGFFRSYLRVLGERTGDIDVVSSRISSPEDGMCCDREEWHVHMSLAAGEESSVQDQVDGITQAWNKVTVTVEADGLGEKGAKVVVTLSGIDDV